MNRRDLIRLLALSGLSTLCGCSSHPLRIFMPLSEENDPKAGGDIAEVSAPLPISEKEVPTSKATASEVSEVLLNDARLRSRYFEQTFPSDIYFRDRKLELMKSLVSKLRAVQRRVGHGNFNILGMDDFFRIAATASGSSEVTAEEKLFLEEVFFFDAKAYGFEGDKVAQKMTETIRESAIFKVPYTGHFLRKGSPLETYHKIVKEVGDTVVLTSGVRGLAKQYHLFFEKALVTQGNISKASRSLAPPGYSFHGQGDFDIGKRGYGLKNFTNEFASTEEFKKLIGLGYVQIRYTENNLLGVRFEPWHIKVPAES